MAYILLLQNIVGWFFLHRDLKDQFIVFMAVAAFPTGIKGQTIVLTDLAVRNKESCAIRRIDDKIGTSRVRCTLNEVSLRVILDIANRAEDHQFNVWNSSQFCKLVGYIPTRDLFETLPLENDPRDFLLTLNVCFRSS